MNHAPERIGEAAAWILTALIALIILFVILIFLALLVRFFVGVVT